MLSLVNVSKSYNKNKALAVDNVSFRVEAGEVLGLVGTNGAGKSTTVSMIATLIRPDFGEILFKGTSIVKHPEEIRKYLGYVPQDIALYESLSGIDNMEFWAKAYHINRFDFQIGYKKACEIINFSQDMLKKKVKDYSGGMKRRLNIGVALMHNPQLVILDEPTVGIDILSRNQILQAIKELAKEKTAIIYVGHYMEEVEKISDRICILNQGKCILNETLERAKNIYGKRLSLEQVYEELIR